MMAELMTLRPLFPGASEADELDIIAYNTTSGSDILLVDVNKP
jgi:hypothetical protein